jgi:hypothetical protein
MGIKAIKVILGVTASFTLLAGCHAQAILASPAKAVTAASGPYTWRNVKIIAGGFVDGLIFNPAAKDVLYARTDIGGPYRWDAATQRWIPLLDWLGPADWNLTGVESIGIDPTNARRVYLAVGTYTNSWAGNGAILRSNDAGRTWQRTDLPFKNGGNMDGRSAGERLSVDLNKDSVRRDLEPGQQFSGAGPDQRRRCGFYFVSAQQRRHGQTDTRDLCWRSAGRPQLI